MKPILFNTEMVRAILDGLKSVTRRVVKPQHLRVLDSPYHRKHPETPDKVLIERLCMPPYRLGDILYVREAWAKVGDKYLYRADDDCQWVDKPTDGYSEGWNFIKWRPSVHMPKEAARLFLRVTDVRVERLREIKQVREEGIKTSDGCNICYAANGSCVPNQSACGCDNEIEKFGDLWDSTVKKADLPRCGWAANPWVWVIEFERISKEEALANTKQHDRG